MNVLAKITVSSLLCLAFMGCDTRIQQGLDERQANEILTALLERNFNPRKVLEPGKKPTWAIEVTSSQADDATRVLVELGLPRAKQPSTLELLKPGLVPSPAEEFQAKLVGREGDSARTLESVDGVLMARVHLVLPPPSRPGVSKVVAKASAFLKLRSGAKDRIDREGLKALIAGSVEGLAVENVTIVLNEATTLISVPTATPEKRFDRVRPWVAGMGLLLTLASLALGLFIWKRGRTSEVHRDDSRTIRTEPRARISVVGDRKQVKKGGES